MSLTNKLLLLIITSILCLVVMSTVGFFQIQRIHNTTVLFADDLMPSIDTIGDIRNDITELKAITLEMIVSHDDQEIMGTLTGEFEKTKFQLQNAIQIYRDQLVSDERDSLLFKEVELAAGPAINSLSVLSSVTKRKKLTKISAVWLKADEDIDHFLDALQKDKDYNDHMAAQSRVDANTAYSNTFVTWFVTSGLVLLMMVGFALWLYHGFVKPIQLLEAKLNDISRALDLNYKISLGSSFELQRTTEAINLLLERAHGGIQDIKIKRDAATEAANHDQLTGLVNRRYTDVLMKDAIKHSALTGKKVAILYIDLDGFKAVNDTYGHDAGDFVLKEVAQRLVNTLRGGDIAARIGGDEFLVVIGGLSDSKNAAGIAQNIISRLSKEIDYQGQMLKVGASIGIAVYPDHGDDVENLKHSADEAMYGVKLKGKNNFAFFASDI